MTPGRGQRPRTAQKRKHQVVTGSVLMITAISTTGRSQRQDRQADRQRGRDKLRLPCLWLTDTGTSHPKAADQRPKAPGAQEARQDLFPRGDNGSVLFPRWVRPCCLWRALGPPGSFREPPASKATFGDKVSHLASSSCLPRTSLQASPPRIWGPGRVGFGFSLSSVHPGGQRPLGVQAADLGRGRRGQAGGAHTGVVLRLSMLRSCWKKPCTCRKPASWSGL